MSPTRQLDVRIVSDARLPNGGVITAAVQNDQAKYSTEWFFTTSGALFGMRGLYNFCPDPRQFRVEGSETDLSGSSTTTSTIGGGPSTKPPSRLSIGAEFFYGLLNKAGGMSVGLRFSTLPPYSGSSPSDRTTPAQTSSTSQLQPQSNALSDHSTFPYTTTLTFTPLSGSLCATYSVRAGKRVSLSSQYDFNFFSYESGVILGAEVWRSYRDTRSGRSTLDSNDDGVADNDNGGGPTTSTETINANATNPGEQSSRAAVVSPPEASRPGIHISSHPYPEPDPDSTTVTTPESSTPIDPDAIKSVIKARIDQDFRLRLLYESRFKEIIFTIGANLDLRAPFSPDPLSSSSSAAALSLSLPLSSSTSTPSASTSSSPSGLSTSKPVIGGVGSELGAAAAVAAAATAEVTGEAPPGTGRDTVAAVGAMHPSRSASYEPGQKNGSVPSSSAVIQRSGGRYFGGSVYGRPVGPFIIGLGVHLSFSS